MWKGIFRTAAALIALVMITYYYAALYKHYRLPALARDVVLLTGLTFERLDAFREAEDFYARMWENRFCYAQAHGILVELACAQL
jgi:hypothetical protein